MLVSLIPSVRRRRERDSLLEERMRACRPFGWRYWENRTRGSYSPAGTSSPSPSRARRDPLVWLSGARESMPESLAQVLSCLYLLVGFVLSVALLLRGLHDRELHHRCRRGVSSVRKESAADDPGFRRRQNAGGS